MFFEPSEYGEIQWLIGIASAISYIALFGSQNTIIVFAAKNLKIQSAVCIFNRKKHQPPP